MGPEVTKLPRYGTASQSDRRGVYDPGLVLHAYGTVAAIMKMKRTVRLVTLLLRTSKCYKLCQVISARDGGKCSFAKFYIWDSSGVTFSVTIEVLGSRLRERDFTREVAQATLSTRQSLRLWISECAISTPVFTG